MRFFVIILIVGFSIKGYAQPNYNTDLLDTLGQIANSNTPAKYFAKLYYQTIVITNNHISQQPENIRKFVFGFEARFASYFFNSYRNYLTNQPQDIIWQRYYSDTSFSELQYQFMGMNAHINGDMGKSLSDIYCLDTLKVYTPYLIKFQRSLNGLFDSIYVQTKKYKKIKRLHFLTLGTDKIIGKRLILRWRKKQVYLAQLYHCNKIKYEHISKRLKKKMKHNEHFALHWIK